MRGEAGGQFVPVHPVRAFLEQREQAVAVFEAWPVAIGEAHAQLGLERGTAQRLRAYHALRRCAPLSLRSFATQKFPYLSKNGGGVGGSRKKLKGNFMVLFSPLHEETHERLVMYRDGNNCEKLWARPLSVSVEEIECL